jgi:hypothetical protein
MRFRQAAGPGGSFGKTILAALSEAKDSRNQPLTSYKSYTPVRFRQSERVPEQNHGRNLAPRGSIDRKRVVIVVRYGFGDCEYAGRVANKRTACRKVPGPPTGVSEGSKLDGESRFRGDDEADLHTLPFAGDGELD